MPAVDFQRQRVYAFEIEAKLREGPPIPRDKVQSVVNMIWAEQGLEKPPVVQLVPGRRRGTAYGDSLIRIGIGNGDVQLCVRYVLHEVAHCINARLNHVTDGDLRHGATFVAILMKLRVQYANDSFEEMARIAVKHRIQVAGLSGEVDDLYALKNRRDLSPSQRKAIRARIRRLNKAALEAAGQE